MDAAAELIPVRTGIDLEGDEVCVGDASVLDTET
jgi:hypothetical protein